MDAGTAITTSPVYTIATSSDLSIWYFHGQRDTGDDANDFFLLEYSLNGGTSYVPLVTIGDVRTTAIWREATAVIPAGSDLVIRVTVSDGSGPGDVIEGGIDDLSVVPQVPAINVEDVVVDEDAGTIQFTAETTQFAASGPFTVDFETIDGTATGGGVDYATTTGTLNFDGSLGDTETITVSIIDDAIIESTENFTIAFTGVSIGNVDISDTALGTINDDEIVVDNQPLSLFDEFNGYFDYAVTGGSFRDQDNSGDPCSIVATSSANGLTTTIPSTGTIEKAFLLWAHSNPNPDTEVTFEGQSVTADIVYSSTRIDRIFYGMMTDVTSIIQGIANPSTNVYELTDLDIDNTNNTFDYCSTSTVLGGWSLVVFYEDPNLPAVSVNMYHGFDGGQNVSNSYTLDGFFAISSAGAKTTSLSWEGDPSLDGNSAGTTNPNGESLTVTNQSGNTFTLMGDGGQTGNNAYNSTIYDNTVAPIVDIDDSHGVDLDTYDISAFISQGDSEITVDVNLGQDLVISNLVLVKVPGNLIVGNVFEDINYGGGPGRDLATSAGVPVEGARVELYDNSNTFLESTTTNALGEYLLAGMDNGDYSVRVVNTSVQSTRGGGTACTTCIPVQTYRRNYTNAGGFTDISTEIGGANPAGEEVGIATYANAQTLSTITIENEGVLDFDFGFNFNTIVNTNAEGQGSLEQFIINSNALDETGLDIEANSIFDPVPGDDTSIFMIPVTGDPLGRTADVNDLGGYLDINIPNSVVLPVISAGNTVIDGRTQTAYSGDTNPGTIGAGGTTVGTSANTLPNYELPEIQIHRNNGDVLQNTGVNTVIRNIAVYANANAAIRNSGGDLLASNNLLGTDALGSNAGNVAYGIELTGGSNAIEENYIATNTVNGVLVNGGTASVIQDNLITNNGDDACEDNIRVQNGSGIIIRRNLIENAAALGIDTDGISGNVTITENTIRISGQNGGICAGNIENAGIKLDGSNSSITNNIIHNNGGPGIVLAGGNTSGNLISENSIYANGTSGAALGIDIDPTDGLGDGVTLNDNGDGDNGPNGSANFPIVTSAYLSGSNLVVIGWSRPGATIEIFLTDVNEGTATIGDNQLGQSTDYGEGQVFLSAMVEGSTADTDAGISSYTDADGNTDNTNRFQFTIPLAISVSLGEYVTSTATIANTTSEFSPVKIIRVRTVITNRRITYRVQKN